MDGVLYYFDFVYFVGSFILQRYHGQVYFFAYGVRVQEGGSGFF